MVLINAIDTKALVAACSHNKLEPNENGQYNVQEFTFKVKLGFQSNNCLDLFTLDIKERKGDDGKVVQEPKSLSLVDPATAGEHARYIVTKLKPIDIKAALQLPSAHPSRHCIHYGHASCSVPATWRKMKSPQQCFSNSAEQKITAVKS